MFSFSHHRQKVLSELNGTALRPALPFANMGDQPPYCRKPSRPLQTLKQYAEACGCALPTWSDRRMQARLYDAQAETRARVIADADAQAEQARIAELNLNRFINTHLIRLSAIPDNYKQVLNDFTDLVSQLHPDIMSEPVRIKFIFATHCCMLAYHAINLKLFGNAAGFSKAIDNVARSFDTMVDQNATSKEVKKRHYTELARLYSMAGQSDLATDAYLDANLHKGDDEAPDVCILSCSSRPRPLNDQLLARPLSAQESEEDQKLLTSYERTMLPLLVVLLASEQQPPMGTLPRRSL